MTDVPLARLLSRYAPGVPGERAPSPSAHRETPSLSAEGHRAASLFLRSIAAMHGTSSAELLIGLANYHAQLATEKA